METTPVSLTPERAAELHQQYRQHRHYSTTVDREIQRAYRLIAQGRVIIRAIDSIRAAGLGDDNLPKLAIVRADSPACHLERMWDGGARFCAQRWQRENATRQYIELPPDTFARPPQQMPRWHQAQTPLIPIHLRPKTAIEEYHVLWEAEWRPLPARDPVLLRRIGIADLWLVVAAWDLTDVEYAALSTRVHS